MTKAVTIEPIEDRHLEQFQAVIDSVSREREFLGTVEGFPLEQTRQFVESIRGVVVRSLSPSAAVQWSAGATFGVVRLRAFGTWERLESGSFRSGVSRDWAGDSSRKRSTRHMPTA